MADFSANDAMCVKVLLVVKISILLYVNGKIYFKLIHNYQVKEEYCFQL